MENVLSLVLSGGRGAHLYPLTQHRSRAAVPIGGKYRLIDIPISNCLNSNLNRLYVLTQFMSVSLHRHITDTYKFDPFGKGFVEILAAQVTNEGAAWYRGTADAIRQNIRYIHEDDANEILILPDDQIYRFDFRKLLQAHHESGADVTIVLVPVTQSEASGLGVVQVDDTGKITSFVEKPQTEKELNRLRTPATWLQQRGVPAAGQEYLASMGIYLFSRDALFALLNAEPLGNDFAHHIFPRSLKAHHFHGYMFTGPWDHLETVKAYHEASLAMAGDHPPFDFHSPEGVIYTRMRNLPASLISGAQVEHALISDGCQVGSGSRLERCVLGVRSRIGRNATLRDTVVLGSNFYEDEAEPPAKGLPPLGIGNDTLLEGVIVDKNCRIGNKVQIVNRGNIKEAAGDNYVIHDGIVVIPVGAVVPDGTVI